MLWWHYWINLEWDPRKLFLKPLVIHVLLLNQGDCSREQIFLCSDRLGSNNRNLTYYTTNKILLLGKEQPFWYETKVSSSYVYLVLKVATHCDRWCVFLCAMQTAGAIHLQNKTYTFKFPHMSMFRRTHLASCLCCFCSQWKPLSTVTAAWRAIQVSPVTWSLTKVSVSVSVA